LRAEIHQNPYIIVPIQGWIQAMWKLWFHKVKLSDLQKTGKYGKEIGEKSGKLLTKSG